MARGKTDKLRKRIGRVGVVNGGAEERIERLKASGYYERPGYGESKYKLSCLRLIDGRLGYAKPRKAVSVEDVVPERVAAKNTAICPACGERREKKDFFRKGHRGRMKVCVMCYKDGE